VGLMVEHREVMNEHWLMMMTYDDIWWYMMIYDDDIWWLYMMMMMI
jgi:hypothetical protein